MLDYYVRLYRQYNCPIDQFVIFLKRTGSIAASTDQFADTNTTHRYRVIRLWEQNPTPLLANPGLLPLATLAQSDAPNILLEQVASRLGMIEEQEQRSNISACVEIIAGIKFDIETIRRFLREDIVRESVIYQEIIERGKREEALLFIMRQLTRRIGTITPEIRAQIQNLTVAQLEELGEALLDFNNVSNLVDWLQNQ